ncbi:MAG: flavodoxin-dependent (E)-4-hydroxy-3-methylbut-2-enyl-diphosphate synthase [Candidatus Nanoarchaeia archaeon]|nr:flavodoxin-dependent (E)-4-hydroxy-3-methylbut-2-enyl-diphosphate synthase [Candidatus Nanoarchaeia archaeon]
MKTKKTRLIKVGNVNIGGNSEITIQSMCNTKTKDTEQTINQIKELEKAGCDIVRVAVEDMDDALALKKIKENINIPLVADIHFDYKLALESAKYADKLRINPGNIGSKDKVKMVVNAAKERSVPIRIGVNLGSIEKEFKEKFGLTSKAMVESAMKHIKILEYLDFYDIIVSLKASDIKRTVDAYRMISEKIDYPLHLGITEAGTAYSGTIKSSIGIGSLLLDGIGDTIRVSLTSNPVDEVRAGIEILKSLELRNGPIIISCPGCGRTKINLEKITKDVENSVCHLKKPLKIAVMGCEVNGPGEASEADIGIAGATDCAVLFKKGKFIRKIEKSSITECLLKEIEKL